MIRRKEGRHTGLESMIQELWDVETDIDKVDADLPKFEDVNDDVRAAKKISNCKMS